MADLGVGPAEVCRPISGSDEPNTAGQDSGPNEPQCSRTAERPGTFPASFKTGTEGWQQNIPTPDSGCISQASDFATEGDFSLQIDHDSTEGAFYGAEFWGDPKDITGTSAVSVDMKTLGVGTRTAIAVQFEGDFWCQPPEDDWVFVPAGTDPLTVTLEFDTISTAVMAVLSPPKSCPLQT